MTGSQSDRAEFLLTLSDALRALSDPDEIVREAAHVLGERLGASRVLYVEVHGPSAVVATDWVAGVASLEGRAPPLAYAANLLAALRRGETLIVNDLENDPRLDAEESAGFRTVDTSALIVTALMRDGQAVAALSAHSATPRVWTDLEVDLLRETASRAWSAAQQATAERRASELEAALRESDQRLRTAQALAGVGVWDWDVAGDQMHVSPEMDQIYGVWPQASRHGLEGFFERVHTDDVARVRQAVATATASGGPFDIEFRIVRPDGEIRWISSRGGVVRGLDGCVQRVTGINADITSRYRLSEESRYLAAVMDAMAEGVNVVGVDGLIRYSNRRFEQLFGYAPGELNGQSVSVLNAGSPSEQRETVRSIIEHLNRDGVWRGEVQNRRKDGTEFWSQATINTMRHPVFGEVWVSIQADITKRKRIEGELRFVGDAMASMAEGVMVAGTDSVIRYTNARFDELFGYEPGELLGQHTSVLNYGNHSEQLETSGIIDLAVEKNGVWRGEIRNQRKDGREFWTRATVSVLNHPQFGECWVTVQADITELKRLQVDRAAAMTSLQRLRDNMEDEAERLQRELALEIHDEIGAKLTAIGMRLDAAQSAIGHGQPVRGEDLDALRLLVARAAASTRELCARLRPAMLDDLGLVETCRWYLRDWSRNTGIEAEARLQDLPVPLPERLVTDLFRVFQELLTNVARHSGARHVVASCGYESGKVRLVVRDDGHGLSPKRSGGFGLAGIRERLRRHDGSFDIRADSPGTVATVEVPMVAPRGTAARRVGRRA